VTATPVRPGAPAASRPVRRQLAGDAAELAGKGVADGGVLLPGFVLEHGEVVAREADAQFGGAHCVRENAIGVGVDRAIEFSAMGKLLERAIKEAHKLPESEQEAVGAWLLAEIESERRWDELFSRPPSEALKRMAEEALEEHRHGLTTPLDPDRL